MSKKKKKSSLTKLMAKYRFTVLDEGTFEEKMAFRLSRFNVLALLSLVFLLLLSTTFALFVYTPLKYYIPGYADEQIREDAARARYVADSLAQVNTTRDRYISNLKLILSGEIVPEEIKSLDSDSLLAESDLQFEMDPTDSLLRAKVAEEDRFGFVVEESSEASALNTLMFKPLEGVLSAGFNEEIGHFGIDVVAADNEVIKAVMDGTVVFSSWTDDGGYVIQVQHSFNMLSVYKHNSTLFKSVGDAVKAGEVIAVIGNSGEETDGPHLHLELWQDGVAVDPERYLAYEAL